MRGSLGLKHISLHGHQLIYYNYQRAKIALLVCELGWLLTGQPFHHSGLCVPGIKNSMHVNHAAEVVFLGESLSL